MTGGMKHCDENCPGLFDICGKGASFMGTALVGICAQITGTPNSGIFAIVVMFIIGFLIFVKANKVKEA